MISTVAFSACVCVCVCVCKCVCWNDKKMREDRHNSCIMIVTSETFMIYVCILFVTGEDMFLLTERDVRLWGLNDGYKY